MTAERAKMSSHFIHHAQRIAQLWLRGLLAICGIVFAGLISILLGFNGFIGDSPLVDFVHHHPTAAMIAVAILMLMTVVAFLMSRESGSANAPSILEAFRQTRRLFIATSVATMSTLLFTLLLGLVLVRPTWCPTALCAPRPTIKTNPEGVHDSNMEMYLIAYQSAYYVIPGDPGGYDLRDLPNQRIGAALLNSSATATNSACDVFIGVHSLRASGYDILIQQVYLLVEDVPILPTPLNVWHVDTSQIFHGQLYKVEYRGESPESELRAQYSAAPAGFVQLAPDEADQMDIRLSANVPADVQFRIEILYHIANETQVHSLILSQSFEVAFSNSSNWHPYRLKNGQFTPSAS